MRRGFLIFVFSVVAFFWGWNRGITEGGIGRFIETHPTFYRGDTVLYVLGSFHEVINQDQKALGMYQRVMALYPDSRWGDAAQFGIGSSHERLHDRKNALKEFEIYLKKYPRGRFQKSVSNNLSLLKGL
jgi:outer membrane protein assembly factor BamD (BamD/ComL family)